MSISQTFGHSKLITSLRLKQGWRMFKTVGWLWILALPILFLFFLSFLNTLREASPYTIAGIALIAPFWIQYSRKDYPFLVKIGFSPKLIYSLEYVVISLFITLPCYFLFVQALPLVLSTIGAILIAFIPVSNRKKSQGSSPYLNVIPVQAFEWRAGLRQYGWIILILYVLGLAGSYWIAPPLLALFIIATMLPSFYDSCEPKEWMEELMPNAQSLTLKAVLHLKLLFIGLIPLSIAFLLFSSTYWYLLIAVWLFSSLYLLFGLFYKYAHYMPGRKKVNNGFISSIVALGFALPFTAPIAIIYLWRLYRKAQKRLWGSR